VPVAAKSGAGKEWEDVWRGGIIEAHTAGRSSVYACVDAKGKGAGLFHLLLSPSYPTASPNAD
jgi:hypothetical protein